MATLGVAEEYEAFIVQGLTGQILKALPWSTIRWSRVRNEIAQASVSIAPEEGGIECCAPAWPLRPWEWMIRVERNGGIVFDGPITGWSRPSAAQGGNGAFTIRAHDRMAITLKRLIASSYTTTALLDPGPEIVWGVMLDAGIGDLAGSPYVFNLPWHTEFMDRQASKVSAAISVERLERVYDVISSLVQQGVFAYTQVTDTFYAHDGVVRELLGGRGVRPVLNEATVLTIPGVETDALEISTVAYGGSLGTGKSGYPVISTFPNLYGQYMSSTLEIGRQLDRATEVVKYKKTGFGDTREYTTQLDVATQVLAVETATPDVTIEQVSLAPDFGSPLLSADLSNLVPGAYIDIDFQDTCAFDVPFIGVSDEYRYWYTKSFPLLPGNPQVPQYTWMPTPVQSDAIAVGRLERLDVTVGFTEDEGVSEEVLASLVPTAEWDGTIPDWWRDPTAPEGIITEA